MYTFNINSTINETDNQHIAMQMTWNEQPTWFELSDLFLNFLKANGYVFGINEKLDVVDDKPMVEQEEEVIETPRKSKRKAAKL